ALDLFDDIGDLTRLAGQAEGRVFEIGHTSRVMCRLTGLGLVFFEVHTITGHRVHRDFSRYVLWLDSLLNFAALTVFFISIATFSRPTPPWTGVTAPA